MREYNVLTKHCDVVNVERKETRIRKGISWNLNLRIQIYSPFSPSTFSSFSLSILGMALCDMFTLLCPAPGLIYMLTLGNHNRPLSSVAACHAWIAFYEVRIESDYSFGQRRRSAERWTLSLYYCFLPPTIDDPQHVPHRINMVDAGPGCSKVRKWGAKEYEKWQSVGVSLFHFPNYIYPKRKEKLSWGQEMVNWWE